MAEVASKVKLVEPDGCGAEQLRRVAVTLYVPGESGWTRKLCWNVPFTATHWHRSGGSEL